MTELSQVELAVAIDPHPLTIASTACVADILALITLESTTWHSTSTREGGACPSPNPSHQSCVLVITDDHLVGIVTLYDLMRLVNLGKDPSAVAVSEVMSSPVITLNILDFTDIFITLNLFQRHLIHHLPLVDDQGSVVGVVTQDSLQPLLLSFELLHLLTVADVITPFEEMVQVGESQSMVYGLSTTSLAELLQLMAIHRLSSLLIMEVVESSLCPVGIVTGQGILQLLVQGVDLHTVSAQMIEMRSIVTVESTTSLWIVQQLMQERQVHQVVVTHDQNELIGIVTQSSLVGIFNPMSLYGRVKQFIQQRTSKLQEQVEREHLLTQIATQVRASLNLSEVLDSAVTTVRQFLQCDRLLVYRFQPDWSGIVAAESVGTGWRVSLHDAIHDPCFQGKVAELYRDGKMIAIDNIYMAGYPACYMNLLEQYQVKANLVVPILVSDQLWGLLIGHQCGDYRVWRDTDLSLLNEVSVQLAIAIQQATIYQQAQTELAERQRTAAALRASEERFRRIVETTLEGVWIIDAQNCTSYVNPRMAEMLGYRIEEMLGKTLFDFMDEDGRTQAQTNLERRRQGIQEQHDFRFKTKMGQDLWVLISTNPLYDDAGNYMGALAMLTDIRDRKRAEMVLQQQQMFLRTIIDTTPSKIFVKDVEGRYLLANRAFAESNQTTVEDLIGKSDRDFLPDPATAEQFLQENRDVINSQQSLFIPEERKCVNGQEQWFQWQKHPITLPGENISVVLGVGTNITSHKEAQARLRQYERVVSASTDGIALVDRNYVYRLVNDVYLARYNKRQEEIVGHSVAEFLGETVFETLVRPYLDRALAGEIHQYEAWFDYPDGRRLFMGVTYSPFIELDGTVTGVVVNSHDLTALKQAEEKLQEREQFLRSIYEGVEQAIFTVDVLADGDFRYEALNPVAERLLSQSSDLIRGKSPEGKACQHYADCVRIGKSITYEECLSLQGRLTWWLTTLNPVRDGSSRICRIVSTSIEITQRKQTETLLEIQKTILEQIAKAEPLQNILMVLLKVMELQLGDALCSILLCNQDGKLHHGVAPRLPDAYMQAIDGVSIGEGVGSCGTAAFRRETVIVADIATDPLWENYRSIALPYGLRACWSVPIVTSTGQVVGTFATYHREIYHPHPRDLEMAALTANIASIAIERAQETQALEQLNRELEHRVEERTLALQASEERWQLALRGTNDGIWDWDLTHNRAFFSSRWKSMRGFAEDEVADRLEEWAESIHPEDFDRVMAALVDHLADKTEFFQVEYRTCCKDGSYLWVLDRGQALRDESGRIVRMSGSESDISQRKRTESALQKSEQRYRALMDGASDAILVANAQGYLIEVNQQAELLLGYSRDEMMQIHISQLHPPEVLEAARHHFRNVIQNNLGPTLESIVVRKDGSWIPVDITASRIEIDGEQMAQGIFRDIRDRKLVEARLRQQANREHLANSISQRIRASLNLQEILNTTVAEVHQVLQSDRVLVYRILSDGRGEVIAESVSQGWPTILGQIFSAEVFPPESYAAYLQGRMFTLSDREAESILPCIVDFLRDIQVNAKIVAPIIKDDILWGLLIAHQCSHPRQWQSWEIDLLKHLSSQLTIAIQQSQLYAQLQDNHQQLTYINAELIQATRLKDEFLANMSHELRTPLNAILGMSESLLEEILGTLNHRQKNAITTIERSGQHLLELINDILELSKIEAGKLELNISTVSVVQLCNLSLSLIKPQAFRKQIQLNIQLAADLGEMMLDERRVRQVLINLLANAVKFTPMGGQVTLEVHREMIGMHKANWMPMTEPMAYSEVVDESDLAASEKSDCLCISVIDTGIGIAPADQAKLFQPFVQVDSSLSRQYEGTGLGLALVKRIVDLHGGEVSVNSELGQGSCFTVRLPHLCEIQNHTIPTISNSNELDEGTASNIAVNEQVTVDVRWPLILLAEDNEANISTISSYLTIKGYRLLVARNGQEAIDLIQTQKPDLVVMDIQMPSIDGLSAIQMIRQEMQLAQMPIIALTALAMDGDQERCLAAGANDYMVKPVKLKQLAATIQQILDQQDRSN